MGFVSDSRITNRTLKLVPAVEVNLLETGYYEILGACGHRLTVVIRRDADSWRARIEAGRGHRKRCVYCPK